MRRIKLLSFVILSTVIPAAFGAAPLHASGRKEKESPRPVPVVSKFKQELDAKIDEAGGDIGRFVDWIYDRFKSATPWEQIGLNRILFILGAPTVGDPPASKSVGPIMVVVTDDETGLPLDDITIYYQLEKVRWLSKHQIEDPTIKLENLKPYILNRGEVSLSARFYSEEYITLELEKLKTNASGEISIPARNYMVEEALEHLTRIYIYINLDTNDSSIPKENEMFNFSNFIIARNKITDSKIVFANDEYYAARVDVTNYDDNAISDGPDEYLLDNSYWYYLGTPFSKGEIKVTVKLAKNTD